MIQPKRYLPRTLSLFIILVLLGGQITASTGENLQKDKFNKFYLKNLKYDFVKVSTAPFKWDTKDLLTLSAVLGIGYLLFEQDEDIQQWFQERRSSASYDRARFVTKFGDGLYLSALLAGLYASGELLGKEGLKKTALMSFESFLVSGIIINGLKSLPGRARPFTGEEDDSFHPFSLAGKHRALPSGHTAAAFSVATVIASESNSFIVDVLSFGLASLVGISRIELDKHWASDVFLGAALGYFVGKKILALNRNRSSNKLQVGFQISPTRMGLTLSFNF